MTIYITPDFVFDELTKTWINSKTGQGYTQEFLDDCIEEVLYVPPAPPRPFVIPAEE